MDFRFPWGSVFVLRLRPAKGLFEEPEPWPWPAGFEPKRAMLYSVLGYSNVFTRSRADRASSIFEVTALLLLMA